MTSVFISKFLFTSLSVKVMPQLTGFQQDWSRVKQIAKVILWHMHTHAHTAFNHVEQAQKWQSFESYIFGNFCHGNTTANNNMQEKTEKLFLSAYEYKYNIIFFTSCFFPRRINLFYRFEHGGLFQACECKTTEKQHQQKLSRELWIYISLIFRLFPPSVVCQTKTLQCFMVCVLFPCTFLCSFFPLYYCCTMKCRVTRYDTA